MKHISKEKVSGIFFSYINHLLSFTNEFEPSFPSNVLAARVSSHSFEIDGMSMRWMII